MKDSCEFNQMYVVTQCQHGLTWRSRGTRQKQRAHQRYVRLSNQMPYFKLMLAGEGVSLPIEGETDPVIGFYTTRIVEAKDPESAAIAAKELVLAEWQQGECALNNQTGLPTITIESCQEVGFFRGVFRRRPRGYTFFQFNE